MNLPTRLIVGDGDFSYSRSLLENTLDERVVVSCIETREELCRKYKNASDNIHALSLRKDWKVMFSVDATNITASFPDQTFSQIQFNFPHCGGKSNIKRNRQLLRDFFRSASQHLSNINSSVCVSLCRGQGGTVVDGPHRRVWGDSWQVQEAAAMAGLILVHAYPFVFGCAYSPTGFRSQARPFGTNGSLTHVFCPSVASIEISIDPFMMHKEDFLCLRHVARLYRMKLPWLPSHPFQRMASRILTRLTQWCPDLQMVALPDSLLADDLHFYPSEKLYGILSHSTTNSIPVAFLPSSPFYLSSHLSNNSAGLLQCFKRGKTGNVCFDSCLLACVNSDHCSAVQWCRSFLSEIVPAYRETCGSDCDPAVFVPNSIKEWTCLWTDAEPTSDCFAALTIASDLSRDNSCLLSFSLNRLAAAKLSLKDSLVLESDDPRLVVEESQLRLPVSLHPREISTDMSFWLPVDRPFDGAAFLDYAYALSDGTLQSCVLLETYTRTSDQRTSHCYRLTYQSIDRALSQGTMHQLQSKLRLFCRDHLSIELR